MKRLFSSVFCCLLFVGSFAQGIPGACGSHPKDWVDPLNGNNTLGMTFNQSACGLNYASASQLTQTRSQPNFNTNGTGLPTTLGISGIPSCPTIVRSYVWYTVSYQGALPTSSSVVINSVTVPAVNIGQSGQKCWGETGTVVFRADVTANATGNGTYNIDITGLANKNWEVDGVTLMIIYRDNSATYQGSLVLWDGANTCSSGGCNKTQTMTGISACGASTVARAFLVVSDMQTAGMNPPTHNSTLNGATAAYSNDFYNFDVVNTSVTNAQANASFGTNANNGFDCYCWSLMGLYYQTTTCVTCTPAALSATVIPTQITCGTIGSASVTASGSPPPYTYSWSTGATTTAISNLSAGNYSVVVTDATGCTASQTFAITMSSVPTVTVTPTPAQCFGTSTGSAITNTTGGTAPYTYVWSTTPVQNTSNANGLAAGTYSITVTDALGCSVPLTVTITQPPVITVSVTPVNPTCGGTNGSASVISGGGTGAHTYLWSTAAAGTSISNLAPGSYSIDVTDASGCSQSQTFNISTSGTLSVAPTSNPVLCFGANTGSASATTTGGTPPYTYAWSPAVTVTANASNLPAGTYSCLVTDALGCSFTTTYSITQPAAALTTSTTVVNNVSCFGGNDGSASTGPAGGTTPYTYAWTPGTQNTPTITGLITGNYSALITDANGCTVSQGVTITEPSIISLPSSATTASCAQADGSATVTPSGGVGPYTYLWLTNPSVQTTPTAGNLLAGTYSVIVTDANGCFQSQSVVVPGLVPPVADFYFSPDVVNLMDPLVTFTDASGGVITNWHWNFGDPVSGANDTSNLQDPTHLYSDSGTYCITLTIMNMTGACADTVTKCLRVEPQTTFYVPNSFTPNKDGKNEIFYAYGTYIGEFHMYIFDRWGNLIFESNDLYKGWDGSVRNKGDIVQEDVYVWKVKYFDLTGAEFNQVGHVTIVR